MGKRRAKRDGRLKPLSLYPLTVEEAVKGLLAVPPPTGLRPLRESAKKPKRRHK